MARFTSIRTRVIVLLGSFLALTLGSLGLFVNAFTTRGIREQDRAREALFAHNIQISINQVLFAGKYQAQAFLETVRKITDDLAYVAIVDGQHHEVLAHGDPKHVGERWNDPTTLKALASMQTGAVVYQRVQGPNGETIHDWALPYLRGYLRRPEGVIRIGILASREEELVRQARLYTFALVLAFLLAGTGLAVLMSRRLTAGLEELTRTARRLGEGDLQAVAPVPAQPRDELDVLGEAFNQMAGRLQEYAGNLENLVAERTAQLALANRRLRESEARLWAFIDHADAVIYMKDLDGRYLMVNRRFEAAIGVAREDIVGKTDEQLVPPETREAFQASDQAVVAHGEPLRYEEVVADPVGERVYLSTKFAVRDEDGAIAVIGGISTDITARKELEELMRDQLEKLKELDRLKGEFVNAVSHDLRTPLTSIKGYAEFLEDGLGGELGAEQLGFVAQIQKATRRLEGLVDDLLDAARIEAGTFRLRREQADLCPLIAEIVESLRPLADEHRLALTHASPAEPCHAAVDVRRIQQVLTNFLHNAIKFTPTGGRVAVVLTREGDMFRCEVRDNGPGIAPEDLPRLFQRFGQLQGGMAKGGTGLGLAISKSIVEAHGGEVGVHSRPGVETTFWFTLPAASVVLSSPHGSAHRPA